MLSSVALEFGTQPDSKGIKDVLTHLFRNQYLRRMGERVRVRVDSRVRVLSESWLLRRIVRVEIDVVRLGRSFRPDRPPGTETGGLAHGGLCNLTTKTGGSILVHPMSRRRRSEDSVIVSLTISPGSDWGKNSPCRGDTTKDNCRSF